MTNYHKGVIKIHINMNEDLNWIDTNQALIYEYIEKQTILSHLDKELKRITEQRNIARIKFNDILDRYTENLRQQNGITNRYSCTLYTMVALRRVNWSTYYRESN